MKRIFRHIIFAFTSIFLLVLFFPQNLKMPVMGGNRFSYNPKSFWYGGWGTSVVHKGVDIFAKKGTIVKSSTMGLVLSTANFGKGGKFVVVLGPHWRIHYYAHLNEIKTQPFTFVTHNITIGTVGNTGNAKSTPSHLHYSISTLIPYPWRWDESTQGWKKMFYLNPINYLEE